MAWPVGVTSSWVSGERLAHGDAQLEFDEVEAGDHLGDGVLDLEPGVHLDEPEHSGGSAPEDPPSSSTRNSHVPALR